MAILALCYRMGVVPSFMLFRQLTEGLVRRSLELSVPEVVTHASYPHALRIIMSNQLRCLSTIFTMMHLGALLHVPTLRPRAHLKDVSSGQANIPVPVMNYVDKTLPDFRWLSHRIAMSGISLEIAPEFKSHCNCSGVCTDACSCAFDMRDALPYNEEGLVRPDILENPTSIYECNSMCSCNDACHNRVVQRGPWVPTLVFRTEKKGWALMTLSDIPKGAFVIECVGEIIDENEAEDRGRAYDAAGVSHLFDLDHDSQKSSSYTIDMTAQGNHARFINHSCRPNLAPLYVWVENPLKDLPHIALFSIRPISAGEELSFDYRYANNQKVRCQCNSKHCRGFLC